ncbi:AAA family ATPase, partial [Oleiphilus sp. HI0043]
MTNGSTRNIQFAIVSRDTMLLKTITISGYKSISCDYPQTIEFEPELTAFIGHNGTGKSAALEALNKLFSIDHSLRGISPSDFHVADDAEPNTQRDLSIEAIFTLTNADGNPSVPPLINGLTVSSSTGEVIFRVRLEASLNFDYSPLGDVDESIWVIDGDMEDPDEENKHRLSATQRNAIQVNYIPANRDPLVQL